MIKNITAFVSAKPFQAGIAGVRIMPDRVAATDSYKLIELKADTAVAGPFTVKLPKGVKTFDSVTIKDNAAQITNKGALYAAEVIAEEFPKYEQLIPKTEDAKISVTVNAEYLMQIAEAFKAHGKQGQVTLHLYDDKHKPILCTESDGKLTALLMPVMQK